MASIIFVCMSYHHLLVSTAKVMADSLKADLLIVRYPEALDDHIDERVRASKIFNNVYMIYEKHAPWWRSRKRIFSYAASRFFELKRYYDYTLPFDFKSYDDIYIFLDSGSIGAYLNILKLKYHLIEDAKGALTTEIIKRTKKKKGRMLYEPNIFMRFGKNIGWFIPICGESKYCTDIEVDTLDGLYYTKRNIGKFKAVSEDSYFSKLSQNNVQRIYDLFSQGIIFDVNKKYDLLLTEPLQMDGRVETIEQQYSIYLRLLSKEKIDNCLMVKPHPRDMCDYSTLKLVNGLQVLPRHFPAEILMFSSNNMIDKAYTITSSSIQSFPAEKRVIWGENSIKDSL